MCEAQGDIKPTVLFKQNRPKFKLFSLAINPCILIAKGKCSSLLTYKEMGKQGMKVKKHTKSCLFQKINDPKHWIKNLLYETFFLTASELWT